jgi:NADH-quinone oxidoreductase subunit J
VTLSILFFIVIGAVSLAAAVGVVASREPVHSALFLLVNFITLAVFFVMLDAQFLAAAQVIIYAGGIVILILFVIMLIGSDQSQTRAGYRQWTPFAGVLLGVILISSMIFGFVETGNAPDVSTGLLGGAPKPLGLVLFTQYILPFELAAVLLLVALLGALLLARFPKKEV